MLLAIDVGNTNMVFGLYEGSELRGTFRISTNAASTSDEIGMTILQYYHFCGYDPKQTKAVIIASGRAASDVFADQRNPQVFCPAPGGRGAGCRDRDRQPLRQSARGRRGPPGQCCGGD